MRSQWINKLAAAVLFLCAAGFNLPAQVSLISTGAVWRYLDNGVDQGTAWISPTFPDGGWSSGQAPLGYSTDGDTLFATTNSFGGDDTNKIPTYYYRHSFNLPDASTVTNLRAQLMRDDGAAVYLNGTEVFRVNLTNDPVLFTDFASGTVSGTDESALFPFSISPSLLVSGDNVVAVEIHQVSPTSSDISFDFGLEGNPLPEIAITSPTNGASLTLVNLPISVSATPGGESIVKVEFFEGANKLGESVSAPYNFVWLNVASGTYSLTAKVTDTSGLTATSEPVSISVQTPLSSPFVAKGDIWKYFIGISEASTPTTLWREFSFDDGSWPSGPTPIGYGDSDGIFPATTIRGSDTSPTWTTVYLRKTFEVSNLDRVLDLNLEVVVDDGVIAFINGVEVGRINANSGEQPFNAVAPEAAETRVLQVSFADPSTVLVEGQNVIALHGLNANTTSSDFLVDTLLIGDYPPSVTLTSPSEGQVFQAPALITLTADAFDEGGGDVSAVSFFDGDLLIGSVPSAPYSLVWSNNFDGPHVLTAVVTDNTGNSATSTPVNIRIVDTNPPELAGASATTNEVTVFFSKRITEQSATNVFNYAITNLTESISILNAALSETGNSVLLTTSPMVEGRSYTLIVNNIQSLDEQVIAPDSQTQFTIQAFLLANIGSPSIPGNSIRVADGFDLSGSGTNIAGTADQFVFNYVDRADDFDLEIRLDNLVGPDSWAKAALMARDTLNANSRFAASVATPSVAGCFFQARTVVGGVASMNGYFPANYPQTWLRLRRAGDVFTGYASLDGQNWSELGAVILSGAPRPMRVGFAVASARLSEAATGGFRDFGDATGDPTTGAAFDREPLGPSNRRGPLVISEIMYNPKKPPGFPGSLEFIEVFNSQAWDEDIGNYRISSAVDYTFPPTTTIKSGGFLVVARDPASFQAFYGFPALGPWENAPTNGLPNDGGRLRLRGRADEVLFEVNFLDRAPWPEAADGAGHSIVLARPSFGEDDPRAWAASDRIGGSPGGYDALGQEPMRNVVINEFLAHTDDPVFDFIELYNHSAQAVDISGAWLSDDPDTNRFRIPNNTVLPARGYVSFDQNQLGFALSSGGERIFLVNSNQSRVIDALRFEGQANGVSSGRYPNGAPTFFALSSRTPAQPNTRPRTRDIVINEIMYNPISGDSIDEYVEIYNKGESPVDVSGWRFTDGINYVLPPNTVVPTNGYLVVANTVTNLLAKYPQLNAQNTKGNYNGSLANAGERIALSMPELVVGTNDMGRLETNIIYIVVDEVTYDDGGRWGWWSDGGGSSLELKDPNSDNNLAANWADSDESQKAPWTVISGTAGIGETLVGDARGDGLGSGPANVNLQIFLLGVGECLIDDVEARTSGGVNLIANNPGFESGLSGWTLHGSHDHSVASSEAFSGSGSMLLRAASRGDNGPNRIRSPQFSQTASGTMTLACKARWVRGWPEILLRIKGGGHEVGGMFNLPSNLGSPGLPNSQAVANAGPAIWDVIHNPILPPAGAPIRVTARVSDPDGISSVFLKYRNDSSGGAYQSAVMVDTGSAGDAVANDGLYTGTILGQNGGVTIAFYLESVDTRGATNLFPQDVFPPPGQTRIFPTDASTRELVVRWGERMIPGSFGNYRLWLTRNNTDRWRLRDRLNNAVMDATFVYNNYRVIYNMKPQYAGSPWHQDQMTSGPDGTQKVDFDIEYPKDDRFLGENDAVWNYPGNPGGTGSSDTSAQSEQTSYLMFKGLNIHYNYRRYVHIFVNGSQRSTISGIAGNFIMEDSQQPNGVTIQEWCPDDTQGDFFKIEDWFEFYDTSPGNNPVGFMNNDADLTRRNIPGTSTVSIAPYRFMFRLRSLDAGQSANDYSSFVNLVNIVSPNSNPNSNPLENVASFYGIANVEQWMRIFAVQHAVGNWDSYGYNRGKNAYTYKPNGGRFDQWTWDIDFTMGVGGDNPPGWFSTTDSRITAMWNVPEIRRAYVRAWQDLIDGPWNSQYANPILDAKAAALRANNVNYTQSTLDTIKSYITSIRTQLQSQISAVEGSPAVPFAVTNVPPSITADTNLIVLTGTAPVKIKDLTVNGVLVPITWLDYRSWRLAFVAAPGINTYTVAGLDSQGNLVSGSSQTITVNFTGQPVDPVGTIVFNEIMYHPTVPNASFVEINNRSSDVSFDISGWRVNGLDFTFPPSSFIANNQSLVLAKDLGAFASAYGGSISVAGVFDGNLDLDGETLTLLIPGTNGAPDIEVDKVRYEPEEPWIRSADGTGPSLQLIDGEQDNSRASNWSDGIGWRYFSATNYITRFNNPVVLYLKQAGEAYVDDVQLVNISDPGDGTNYILNGDFESGLSPWLLFGNHSNTVVSSEVAYEGSHSLHIISAGAGNSANAVRENITISAPYLPPASNVYMVSFRYLPVTPNSLLWRAASSQLFDLTVGVDISPILSTPGAVNTTVDSLPPYDSVWLNEVAPNNTSGLADGQGQFDPWIELFNPGPDPVSLEGYYLANNYRSNLTQWAFPAGTSIASNEFKIVWLDGQPGQTIGNELHANFALASSTGSVALVRLVNDTPQVTDYLNYKGLLPDQSYGDFPDGQPFKRVVMNTKSPGAPNIAKPVDIYINEWMAGNTFTLSDPVDFNFEDWFELYNAGNEAVDLTGYFLTDDLADKNQFQIPPGYVIPPGGFLLVWADNDPEQNLVSPTQLHANFALSRDGESIGLYAPNGIMIDEITFLTQTNDVSEGRFPDGSAELHKMNNPTPAAPNQLDDGNTAPVLAPIDDATITLGQTVSLALSATDAEVPPQTLAFSLLPGAPTGANVASTGTTTAQFNWTPAPNQAPSTNIITARVTDNAAAPLSDQESFTVVVLLPPQIGIGTANGEVTLSFPTIPGRTYRVLYADTLDDPIDWQQLGPDQLATGTSLEIIDTIGANTQRFYQIQQVN